MSILEVYRGTNLIGSFLLTGDLITIGRAGDNDIVLPDKDRRVSRYHAVLLRNVNDQEAYILRDLSSSWGTEISGSHIFQKMLGDKDIIHIADFKLDYITSKQKKRTKGSLVSSSFTPDIGDLSTITKSLEENIELLLPGLAAEIKLLFEELLFQIENSVRSERLLDSAMNLLLRALNMGEGCSGCFGLFEGDEGERIVARRGMESRVPMMPGLVIEEIKKGLSKHIGNQLWVPLFIKEGRICQGFLYLCKGPYDHPFNKREVEIVSCIGRMIGVVIQTEENSPSDGEEFVVWPTTMVGSGAILKEIQRAASTDSNILLLGETGVGKEVAADEIHRQSKRREKPLRKVNCPGIPNNLLEEILFGHKKGTFTNATEDRRGEFEAADGGTIFLDEIGNLPLDFQSKILRIIQDKIVQRVGEEKTKKVDVRTIAATSSDIDKMKEEGQFRNDLYYRFGERILIPPLRERKKDIHVLAHYFLDKYASKMNLRIRGITTQAMHHLLSYPWPGNIRELENAIEKALSKSKGLICLQHLPDEVQDFKTGAEKLTSKKSKPRSIDDMEKAHIMEILQYTRGNKEKAAAILKISKPTLYSKIRKYGIKTDFQMGS